MKKFSQIEEAAPAGHRLIHHGITLSKGAWDGNQKFKRITLSTPHPDHAGLAQPDGKYGNHLHSSAYVGMIKGHPKHAEISKLKKEGWSVSEHGRKSSLSKADVMKAFDEHEKSHRERHGKFNLDK